MHWLPLVIVSLGHLVVDMYLGGLPVLLPVLMDAYSLSYAQVGFLMFLAQVSSSVVQPVFGYVSDGAGLRSVLQWGLVVAAFGLALIVFSPSYLVVLLATALCGLGVAAYHPEASKIAHYAGGTRKATAMSAFSLSGNIGLALGPGLMTLGLSVGGIRGALVFVPVALLILAWIDRRKDQLYSLLPSRGKSPTPARTSKPSRNAVALFQKLRPSKMQRHHRWMAILLVYIFLRSSAHTGMQTLIPLYFQGYKGADGLVSGALLTSFLVGGVGGTILGGLASDWFGSRLIAILSFVTSPLLIAAVPYAGTGWGGLGLTFLAGVTLIASFSLTTVMGQKIFPSRVGLASGLTLGFSVGTGGVGAAALGLIADLWGLESSFWAISILLAIGVIFAFLLPTDRAIEQYFQRASAG